jgi:predicted nuclease of restriction endonuclease-like (RecB) superfamily
MTVETNSALLISVKEVINRARVFAHKSVNAVLLKMYWEIGELIVENEQKGKAKAVYGKEVLKKLAKQLTVEFGKGFDERNLNNMRAFYLAFPIWNAVRTELSWTHYRLISRIDNEEQRLNFISYSVEENWDTRTLERNIKTKYIGRIIDSKKTLKSTPNAILKDPYIFEFLGIPNNASITENKLETEIINNLQKFLMELGKGFAFVARQQHIVTDTSDFYIDLVFYNYYLKCFVLIDLKTDKLSHAAIGQMDMYVRMYNDLKKSDDDNPTIGLILCTEKDETIVKYSVLSENEKLFASKYRLYLPEEDELIKLIETDRINFKLNQLK